MVRVFTIVSCNHLAGARALMRSVAQHLPSARRTVFLTDDPAGRFDPTREDFESLAATATSLPRYRHRAFVFTPAELCFVLKPFCAEFLLARDTSETLLYLDADTLLFAPPHELIATARTHGLALTPHLTDPVASAHTALPTMRSGAINGGVFALAPGRLARAFVTWWGRQLEEPANIASDWGHDQGWLALVPGLFPEYGLLRHPGYNVAFWNLHERVISNSADAVLQANGLPLALFHFSYFDPALPDRLTGRMTTNLAEPNDAVRRLLCDYAANLHACGYETCRRWGYGYGMFSDGQPVTIAHRRYFAERLFSTIGETDDPFDPALNLRGYSGLKSLYCAGHPLPRHARSLKAALRALRR